MVVSAVAEVVDAAEASVDEEEVGEEDEVADLVDVVHKIMALLNT